MESLLICQQKAFRMLRETLCADAWIKYRNFDQPTPCFCGTLGFLHWWSLQLYQRRTRMRKYSQQVLIQESRWLRTRKSLTGWSAQWRGEEPGQWAKSKSRPSTRRPSTQCQALQSNRLTASGALKRPQVTTEMTVARNSFLEWIQLVTLHTLQWLSSDRWGSSLCGFRDSTISSVPLDEVQRSQRKPALRSGAAQLLDSWDRSARVCSMNEVSTRNKEYKQGMWYTLKRWNAAQPIAFGAVCKDKGVWINRSTLHTQNHLR